MTGGRLIRDARRRAKLTQSELARRLGTSQSVIVRWERGQRSPTFATLERAVRACGFDLVTTIAEADPDLDRSIALRLSMSVGQRVDANEILLDEASLFAGAGRVDGA